VLDLSGDLARQQPLELKDAAYAWRDDKGKVRIQQAIGLTGARAAPGALWGTLIALIFLIPVAGRAIGAGTGALAGKLADVGVNDDTLKQIRRPAGSHPRRWPPSVSALAGGDRPGWARRPGRRRAPW
jgi:uncharacterized membrane protein